MEESMRRLMHNVELLVVLMGKGDWRGAAEAISQAKLLLGELERDMQSKAEARARKAPGSRTILIP